MVQICSFFAGLTTFLYFIIRVGRGGILQAFDTGKMLRLSLVVAAVRLSLTRFSRIWTTGAGRLGEREGLCRGLLQSPGPRLQKCSLQRLALRAQLAVFYVELRTAMHRWLARPLD